MIIYRAEKKHFAKIIILFAGITELIKPRDALTPKVEKTKLEGRG